MYIPAKQQEKERAGKKEKKPQAGRLVRALNVVCVYGLG